MIEEEKQSLNQSDVTADSSEQAFLNGQFKKLRIISIFLFPIITFLAFRAQDIISFFSGKGVEFAILPFQIIIWSVILIYYSFLFLRIAIFLNRKSIVLFSLLILALYTIVLNFYLIPLCGLKGISIATVISVAVMFIFILLSFNKAGIKIPLYKSCERPAVATMGMTVVLHYVDSWAFYLILICGFVSCFLILIILFALGK